MYEKNQCKLIPPNRDEIITLWAWGNIDAAVFYIFSYFQMSINNTTVQSTYQELK